MASAPSVQLTIHYRAADPQARNDYLRSVGVTEMTDMLVRRPRALCVARVVGKTADEVEKLVACLRAAGAGAAVDLDAHAGPSADDP